MLRDRISRRRDVEFSAPAIVLGMQILTVKGVPVWLIKRTVESGLSPLPRSTIVGSGIASAIRRTGWAFSQITIAFKKLPVNALAAGVGVMVVVSAVFWARTETTSFAMTPAVRGDEKPQSEVGRADSVSKKIPLSGTIVNHDGSAAKSARVFISTVDHAFDGVVGHDDILTGDRGEFQLPMPVVDVPWAGWLGTGTLWAFKPGCLVPTLPIYRGAVPPGLPQRLVLGPPSRAPFEVYLPDGKPAVGALVARPLARRS